MTVKAYVDGVLRDVPAPSVSAGYSVDAEISGNVRRRRNDLIAETDWWATSDRTMTTEQTAYRQALRDITNQAGFPTDITWPTKPE